MDIKWATSSFSSPNYTYGDWTLTVVPTSPEGERQYWLSGPGICEQIHTRGGLYTALDIAAEFIRNKS